MYKQNANTHTTNEIVYWILQTFLQGVWYCNTQQSKKKREKRPFFSLQRGTASSFSKHTLISPYLNVLVLPLSYFHSKPLSLSLFLSGETTQLQWRRFRFRATRTSQVSSEQVKWRRTQPEEWSNRASCLLRVSALHIPTLFAVMPSSPSASPSFPESMTYRSFRSLYTEH